MGYASGALKLNPLHLLLQMQDTWTPPGKRKQKIMQSSWALIKIKEAQGSTLQGTDRKKSCQPCGMCTVPT